LLNTSTALTVTLGSAPTLSAVGLPSQARGAVTFSANGADLCTADVLPDDSVCQVPGSLAVGTYSITATFTDTDGIYSGSTSSNTATLTVSPQTTFAISVNDAPTSTLYATDIATFSEVGLPPTARGTVSFNANGVVLCSFILSGIVDEATDCSISSAVGTYLVTAMFSDTDGVFLGGTSSNSVTLTVNPRISPPPAGSTAQPTTFAIAIDGSSSATLVAGTSPSFSESGLPAAATGTVWFSEDGMGTCSFTLTGAVGEQTSCSAEWAFGPGVFSVSAVFSDTDGGFLSSISSNSVMLAVGSGSSSTSPTSPPTSPTSPTSPVVAPENDGYDLVGSDGGIFTFGNAPFFGSTGALTLQRPVTGITPTSDHGGYWLVASDGGIFTFGDAGFYGSIPGLGLAPAGSSSSKRLNAPIVGMVPSTDGGGYFMVAADGGVFAFGDAKFEGSCLSIGGCSGAAVAVMPDASGDGYWLVTSTGRVYAFGDAASYGAPDPQSGLVTSAVRTTDGAGYWILFANGVVDAYGDAKDLGGPTSSVTTSDPATTIFTTPDGGGYWVASADGSVFTYGDAPYEGGTSGMHLNGPIIAATGW
jgi:hypothetical protein